MFLFNRLLKYDLPSPIKNSKIYTTIKSLDIPRRIIDIYSWGFAGFWVGGFVVGYIELTDVLRCNTEETLSLTISKFFLKIVFSSLLGLMAGSYWPLTVYYSARRD